MSIPYASLADARQENKASSTTGDAALLRALYHIGNRIDTIMNMEYAPRNQTLYTAGCGHHIDAARRILFLDQPLLEVFEIEHDGTALAFGTDVVAYPRVGSPMQGLRRVNGYWTGGIDAISINGVWGYNTSYATAWMLSGDSVGNNPLTDSGTSITVTAVDGTDAYGRTPRFSAGQLLRIEDEYLEIIATPTNTTLTAQRGVRGTEAVEHAQTTPIQIWQVEDTVNRAARRWADYLEQRRGAFNTVTFDGVTTTQFPADIPEEVRNILAELPRYQENHSP